MTRLASALLWATVVYAQSEPNGAGLERATLPRHWSTGGPDCATLPRWQVHEYNDDFYILRESGCIHYEKPFLFLFFGAEKALLIDTGAGAPETAREVRDLVARRSSTRATAGLVVVHSHGHGDHTAGDRGFTDMLGVVVVRPEVAAITKALNVTSWPEGIGSLDLGNRLIDVIPIPGHDAVSLAFYDRRTGILLTGDTVYPGRLYVQDFAAYLASIQRLLRFTADKPVAHILGNHIEQTDTPYLDYPVGTKYQPEEHPLALSRAQLLELAAGLEEMKSHPMRRAFRDFTIWPK